MENQYNNQHNNQYNGQYNVPQQYQQPYYQQPPINVTVQPQKSSSGVCTASLILGLVSLFCCNPLYLTSLAAVITGIIGLTGNRDSKGMAVAGLILGIASVGIWVILDIILAPFTFGISFFI